MLTAVKVKNRISKLNLASDSPVALEFIIKNVKINGTWKGCTGFIKNLHNGTTIYIDTEPCPVIYGGQQLMYRYALDHKDYRGCMNQWAKEDAFCETVYKALFNDARYEKETSIRRTNGW